MNRSLNDGGQNIKAFTVFIRIVMNNGESFIFDLLFPKC